MRPSHLISPTLLALIPATAANPPACLIGALLKQSNPADLASLCGPLQPAMGGNISAVCARGDELSAAYGVYAATCLAAQGVTVPSLAGAGAVPTPTGGGAGTTSGSGSAPSESSKNGGASVRARGRCGVAVSGLVAGLVAGGMVL